ncbi:Hydroxylamine reductase [Monoraphidium neglectum]|uniref:Hydroxylamine reductase n=1 Tax=Monoraphidium neglectum TaxID=145388 RepID=A0A0D2LY97_9CHLO|nr:Hydroxylamine reductase [Monoraphidium neglectum]KIY96379.1 Hydroxylamine reductase [Monoraphidium neglectum]|eukprot:XP_013895399.1 Hydroxylamine reductase [Monoraphidium neglectum]
MSLISLHCSGRMATAARRPAAAPRASFAPRAPCEQTLHGTGCTDVPAGVCGKTADVANLQDLLTFQLKGLSAWTHFAHQNGVETPDIDSFVKAAVFSTLTNVNFDAERFRDYTLRADELTRGLKAQLARANIAGGPAKEPLPW